MHGLNAFWVAAINGSTSIAQLLIDHHADTTVTNSKGSNTLHIVTKKRHLEVIQVLINNKFPLN